MKFAFVTCVQLGKRCMNAIYDAGFELDLVITLPDDRAVHKSGRVFLDDFCAERGIDLLKVRHIDDPVAAETIRARSIDWLFIVGWSQIAGGDVVRAARKGTLGMHPTLLPEGRGRAAIPWAILKNLDRTGVSLFKMDMGVDTGPLLGQVEIPLSHRTTATELYAQVDDAHAQLIRDIMPKLAEDAITPQPQDESRATIWPGRKQEDGRIDLDGSVVDAERMVRAVTRPYPGAFFDRADKRITIWAAHIASAHEGGGDAALEFGDGVLIFDEYQVYTL
jgi:methionyl-tRNA formyltransferase